MSKHSPDAQILSLSARLAVADALFSVCPNDAPGDLASVRYDRECSLLAMINRRRARTLEGLRAKAEGAVIALKWDENASNKGEDSFIGLCKSIIADILTLKV